MTKTEYTAAIAANQTAISAIRTDLRKLSNIEKLAESFPDLKLVDTASLNSTITEKKAKLTKLRADLSKARRIVKRMTEIEDIETGKADTPKAKKSTTTKKGSKADPVTADKKPAEKKAAPSPPLLRSLPPSRRPRRPSSPLPVRRSRRIPPPESNHLTYRVYGGERVFENGRAETGHWPVHRKSPPGADDGRAERRNMEYITKAQYAAIPGDYKGKYMDFDGKHPEWVGRRTAFLPGHGTTLFIEGVSFEINDAKAQERSNA